MLRFITDCAVQCPCTAKGPFVCSANPQDTSYALIALAIQGKKLLSFQLCYLSFAMRSVAILPF